jgi:hypothetical protein
LTTPDFASLNPGYEKTARHPLKIHPPSSAASKALAIAGQLLPARAASPITMTF